MNPAAKVSRHQDIALFSRLVFAGDSPAPINKDTTAAFVEGFATDARFFRTPDGRLSLCNADAFNGCSAETQAGLLEAFDALLSHDYKRAEFCLKAVETTQATFEAARQVAG